MESLPTTDRTGLLPKEVRVGAMQGADGNDHASNAPEQTPTTISLQEPIAARQDVADAFGSEVTRPFSFFVGLRAILLLYAAAAVVAAFGYEIWCVLTH